MPVTAGQRRSLRTAALALTATFGASIAIAADEPDLRPLTERWTADVQESCTDGRHEANDPESPSFQILPDGLMYRSYLAGPKEPRFATVWLHEKGRGWIWENAIGGRMGVLRYGTGGSVRPQGWQLDIEGAVFARLDWDDHVDLDAADFRVGVPMTWRRGGTAVKFGYYHISSHLGDEFLLKNPTFFRRNFVRDSLILGVAQDVTDDVMLYGEIAWAPIPNGGAGPLEMQLGAEYSPLCGVGFKGAPFAAVNFHLREEFNFGGGVNLVAGWQWRGAKSGRRFRIGGQYYQGKSLQLSFFDKNEELLGLGVWFDY